MDQQRPVSGPVQYPTFTTQESIPVVAPVTIPITENVNTQRVTSRSDKTKICIEPGCTSSKENNQARCKKHHSEFTRAKYIKDKEEKQRAEEEARKFHENMPTTPVDKMLYDNLLVKLGTKFNELGSKVDTLNGNVSVSNTEIGSIKGMISEISHDVSEIMSFQSILAEDVQKMYDLVLNMNKMIMKTNQPTGTSLEEKMNKLGF